MTNKTARQVHHDFLIQRWKQGIRLVNPVKERIRAGDYVTVSHVMRQPINFYFMDQDSTMQDLNEHTAQICGYVSVRDAIGKSIRDVSKRDTAQRIIKNDREIIDTQTLSVVTEAYTRKDDVDLSAVSVKFPWFHEDEVAGIFGCSILTQGDAVMPLAEVLAFLIQTGLLAPSVMKKVDVMSGQDSSSGMHFDQREREILYWLVRGQTAKHIARKLGVSHRTVEHRLEKIKFKLNVTSRAELIDKVIDWLLESPDSGVFDTL